MHNAFENRLGELGIELPQQLRVIGSCRWPSDSEPMAWVLLWQAEQEPCPDAAE